MDGRIDAKEKNVRDNGTKTTVKHRYRRVGREDVAPVTAGLRGEQTPAGQQPEARPTTKSRPRLRTPFG